MTRSLFTPASAEEAVVELDTFRNDILGVAAFSFGLTALQFQSSQAPSIASVSLAFLFLWALVKIAPKTAEHKRLYDNLGFWAGNWRALRTNLILLDGLLFLGFIAGGVLTLDRLLWFSLSGVFAQ